MWRRLVPWLACPECSGPLTLSAGAPPPPDLVDHGTLACAKGHTWPVRRGIPRLIAGGEEPDDATATRRAFERQWRHYGRLARLFGKDRDAMRVHLARGRLDPRIDEAWYAGKRVLDAGCGHGRYVLAFASLGAEAVGVDVGHGPEIAGFPVDAPGTHVVQGDVLRLPFRDATFDLAFCDGVLHHTPDPRRGFAELARVVRPGGAVHVWLYPRERAAREAAFGVARAVTTRLPGGLLRAACFAAAPLTAAVRSYSGTKFPRATWAECAQVVHDWLAPPIQSHHTQAEIERWASEEGLREVRPHPIPVGLTAWKPP